MKRLLPIVILVAVIAAAVWFLFLRGGDAGAARLVPEETVLFLEVPDMQRSADRWPKTALAQIGADPAVADFLALPIERITSGGAAEAKAILDKLNPKSLFLAVISVRQGGGNVVLGFQFQGGKAAYDEAIARLFREMGKNIPNSSTATSDYNGDAVTTFTAGRPVSFSAAHGQWGFLSNNEAALQQALDLAAGRGNAATLADSADFKKVLGHLSTKPDFVWYAQPKSFVDMMAEFAQMQDPEATPERFAEMQKIKALGGTLEFDGANQKELAYILYPGAPKVGPINHSPMQFTTPETSVFFDSAMDTQTIASDSYAQSLPPEARDFFTSAGIDLKKAPEIIGTDFALMLSWPTSALMPNVLAALEIKDRTAAQNIVQSALTALGQNVPSSESHGAAVFKFQGAQLVEPTLAVTDKFVLAALTSAEMERALALQSGAPTLESSPSFKPALATYGKSGMAFGFVDLKALFERVYNMLRPMAVIAGSMSPQVSQFVDVKKMPETDAISSHLTPIVYSCSQTGDGFQLESSGPVTLTQAFVIVAAGGAGAFAAQMSQRVQ